MPLHDRHDGAEPATDQLESLEALFALSRDLLCVVEPDGRLARVNPAFAATLGWEAEDVIGRPLRDLVHAADRAALDTALDAAADAASDGSSALAETRCRCRDGDHRWIAWRVSAPDRQGRVYAVGRDVTGSRHVDAALRESEQRAAAQVEGALDCVVTIDAEGRILAFNPAAERTFGHARADVIGRPMADVLVPAELREAHRAGLARHLATGEARILGRRIEVPAIRADGTRFPVELTVIRLPADGPPVFTAFLRDISDRVRAADALARSEERFRGFVEAAHEGVWALDTIGRTTYVNARAVAMLGYPASALLGRQWFDLMDADDAFAARTRFARGQRGIAESYEVALRHANGERLVAQVAASALQGPDGAFVGMIVLLRDVTARKRDERLAASQSAILELVAAGLPLDAVLAAVVRFVEQEAPDAACTIRPPISGPSGAAHAGADAWSTPSVAPDGTELGTVALRPREGGAALRDMPTDAHRHLLAVASHLAGIALQRARDEERRAHAARYFRALIEHASDMVAVTDADGTYRYASPAHERYLGYAPAALVGRDARTMVHPEDAARVDAEFVQLRARPGGTITVQFRQRHADGGWRTLDAVATNLLHDPAVGGLVVNVHDVTERVRLEEQLRQGQKMEAVGRLAGGVAHDFNNLLLVIQNHGAFVAAALPEESPVRADLAEVLKAAERAAALTRQLLAFGRQQVLQPRRLDVNRTVADVAGMLRRVIGEDIRLTTELSPEAWPVLADPGQLEQVLMNLAVNARDAMPAGGALRLHTANVVIDAADPRARSGLAPGAYVALTVEDAGVGIAPDVLPRIFEPFYTTKPVGAGTGLGLATVYGIVQQSGGHVDVESAPGRGSRFTVLLPRMEPRPADATPPSPAPAAPASPRGSETILVVEDEAPVRLVVRRMLERLGYVVLDAESARDALRLAETAAHPIDLVLTDVVMPGQSGRAFAEQLALARPELRVLYMSGYTDDEILRRGLAEPGATFLEKPFTPERLARAVRGALDG